MQNINKHNECFLIPSQITLNESDIINWKNTKVNIINNYFDTNLLTKIVLS